MWMQPLEATWHLLSAPGPSDIGDKGTDRVGKGVAPTQAPLSPSCWYLGGAVVHGSCPSHNFWGGRAQGAVWGAEKDGQGWVGGMKWWEWV